MPLPTILLIEPEVYVARAFERVLKSAGDLTIVSAASYALERLSAGERYDVILCAVMMRHLTGPEFFKRACHVDPQIASRIVFLSGGMQPPEERFMQTIANRVLSKPVSRDELLAAVAEVVAAHSPAPPPTPSGTN